MPSYQHGCYKLKHLSLSVQLAACAHPLCSVCLHLSHMICISHMDLYIPHGFEYPTLIFISHMDLNNEIGSSHVFLFKLSSYSLFFYYLLVCQPLHLRSQLLSSIIQHMLSSGSFYLFYPLIVMHTV